MGWSRTVYRYVSMQGWDMSTLCAGVYAYVARCFWALVFLLGHIGAASCSGNDIILLYSLDSSEWGMGCELACCIGMS